MFNIFEFLKLSISFDSFHFFSAKDSLNILSNYMKYFSNAKNIVLEGSAQILIQDLVFIVLEQTGNFYCIFVLRIL